MTKTFSYDVVDYPSQPLSQAHPGHLHAVARMFGLDPAPVERCRYLEVGGGDGIHLIGCALVLPEATFVGLDLSASAVERGNRLVAEIGLHNVSLHAADLITWEPPAGGFDYVAAHGLYSWVPPPVRDGLMALFARCLRPQGVGYVSYNTYPGCYVRRMVWEMLKFHAADAPDPAGKIAQATQMLKLLAAGRSNRPDSALALLGPELEKLTEHTHPHVLYHDDLSSVNEPCYLHEFTAHAGRHGLRFVSETEAYTMETSGFPKEVREVLDGLARRDVVLKEQYLDFVRLRRFRETLISPDPQPPREDPDPSRIATLAVSGRLKTEPTTPNLAPGVAVTFRTEKGVTARTDLPIGKAALAVLAERWPGRVPFPELLATAARRLGREPLPDEKDKLAELLGAIWMTGMVELHGHCPRYAATVSEQPIASPLARAQVQQGPIVTTLLHEMMRFDDAPSRLLLQLLDGTRDRDRLATDLLAAFPPNARPGPVELRVGLDRNLDRLAKAGLLVG